MGLSLGTITVPELDSELELEGKPILDGFASGATVGGLRILWMMAVGEWELRLEFDEVLSASCGRVFSSSGSPSAFQSSQDSFF